MGAALNINTGMFLSEQELHGLTGYKRGCDQRRWLITHGWPFEMNGKGKPTVLRTVAVAKLGGSGNHHNGSPRLRLA